MQGSVLSVDLRNFCLYFCNLRSIDLLLSPLHRDIRSRHVEHRRLVLRSFQIGATHICVVFLDRRRTVDIGGALSQRFKVFEHFLLTCHGGCSHGHITSPTRDSEAFLTQEGQLCITWLRRSIHHICVGHRCILPEELIVKMRLGQLASMLINIDRGVFLMIHSS